MGIDDRIGVESGKKGIENWICILNLSLASLFLISKNDLYDARLYKEFVNFDSYAPARIEKKSDRMRNVCGKVPLLAIFLLQTNKTDSGTLTSNENRTVELLFGSDTAGANAASLDLPSP